MSSMQTPSQKNAACDVLNGTSFSLYIKTIEIYLGKQKRTI